MSWRTARFRTYFRGIGGEEVTVSNFVGMMALTDHSVPTLSSCESSLDGVWVGY